LELKVVSGGLYIVHVKADVVPPPGTKLFSWPEDNYYLTQGYGYTTYAKRGAYGGAPHNGIDIASGFGTPIKAIGEGQIVANGSNKGWGNWIAIQHPNNMVSVYGHMSSLALLSVGSRVARGQVIGYEGNTGNATGSHLHLSLYREFFTYLKPATGELYFNYFEGSMDPRGYL
jgi:murein DD-endopeptidase MepM/ murein hydrolase activator NlpD